MLRQVARESEQLRDEPLQPRDVVLFGVEARFDETFGRHFAAPAAPGRVSEPLRDVFAESQRLAGLARRAARPVMATRRGDAGARPRVAARYILHHHLARLVLAIVVDARRLAAYIGPAQRVEKMGGQLDVRGCCTENKTKELSQRHP